MLVSSFSLLSKPTAYPHIPRSQVWSCPTSSPTLQASRIAFLQRRKRLKLRSVPRRCADTRMDTGSSGKDNYWLVFLWTPPLTFDILILSLTVYRYFDLRHRTGGVEIPILRKIVMKHLFYFGVITTSNAINVGFFARESFFFPSQNRSPS